MKAASNKLRPDGLRLMGDKSYLQPFAHSHMEDPEYLGWLRDLEVVRTLNLPRYMESSIAFADVSAYCEAAMTSPRDLFLAIHLKETGAFIGTAKAGHIDWYAETADIGVMIGRKDLWGRGLASDVVRTLCRHLFDAVGLRRLTAGVMATNPAMVRVFEKLGFHREGVFRKHDRLGDEFIDHIHLGCLRPEFVAVAA